MVQLDRETTAQIPGVFLGELKASVSVAVKPVPDPVKIISRSLTWSFCRWPKTCLWNASLPSEITSELTAGFYCKVHYVLYQECLSRTWGQWPDWAPSVVWRSPKALKTVICSSIPSHHTGLWTNSWMTKLLSKMCTAEFSLILLPRGVSALAYPESTYPNESSSLCKSIPAAPS